jgi:cytochrome c oxidase assembly protein subunit 11
MTEQRRTRLTAVLLTGVIAGMLGLTAAAVPLYRLFCQVTGYGGTTQRAERAPDQISDQTIKVRFNAEVAQGIPWSFKPEQREIEIRIGEQQLAFYAARNNGSRPIVGTATFNVTPNKAGAYFSKIDCFCFTEQVLQPGESADLPVSFFVDPAILDDPETQDVRSITLSYTFFMREGGAGDTGETSAGAQPSS